MKIKIIKRSRTPHGNEIKMVQNIDETNILYGCFAIYLKIGGFWQYLISTHDKRYAERIFNKLEKHGY